MTTVPGRPAPPDPATPGVDWLAVGRQILQTQPVSRLLTSEMKINYVRPGVGERLVARAEAVAVSRQQAVCRCDVFAVADGVEKLCAVAQGTIVRMSEVRSEPPAEGRP